MMMMMTTMVVMALFTMIAGLEVADFLIVQNRKMTPLIFLTVFVSCMNMFTFN